MNLKTTTLFLLIFTTIFTNIFATEINKRSKKKHNTFATEIKKTKNKNKYNTFFTPYSSSHNILSEAEKGKINLVRIYNKIKKYESNQKNNKNSFEKQNKITINGILPLIVSSAIYITKNTELENNEKNKNRNKRVEARVLKQINLYENNKKSDKDGYTYGCNKKNITLIIEKLYSVVGCGNFNKYILGELRDEYNIFTISKLQEKIEEQKKENEYMKEKIEKLKEKLEEQKEKTEYMKEKLEKLKEIIDK